MIQTHEVLADDGSGFSFLGDIVVKLRELSLEQLTGVSEPAPEANGSLIKIRIAGSRSGSPPHTQALVAKFHLVPATGKSTVSGRMRLAKTQDVVGIAEVSTGQMLVAVRKVEVTIGGCGNE